MLRWERGNGILMCLTFTFHFSSGCGGGRGNNEIISPSHRPSPKWRERVSDFLAGVRPVQKKNSLPKARYGDLRSLLECKRNRPLLQQRGVSTVDGYFYGQE